jgi:GAF domain-containing protein
VLSRSSSNSRTFSIASGTVEWGEALARYESNFPTAPTRSSLACRAILDGQIVHIRDLDAERGIAESIRALGHKTSLTVPMVRDGRAIGAVSSAAFEVDAFSVSQIELLQTFAEQAVIAISSAETYRELQVRTGDLQESLEYQTATSDVLKVISRSTFDLQPVLDTVAATAVRLCEADLAATVRFSGQSRLSPPRPKFDTVLRQQAFTVDRGTLTGRTALEGRVVHIADVAADPEYARPDVVAVGKLHSSLGVPLLREGVVVGTISLARNRVEPFTERQIALVSTFADQAVIAIENTRLLTEQREALERQTATAEILRVISSSPTDVQPTFDAIAAAATTLSGATSGGGVQFDGSLIHFVAHHGWTAAELDAVHGVFPLPPGRGSVTARAILTREVGHVADIAADPEFEHMSLTQDGIHTTLSVPMLRDGNAIAAITVTRHEVEPFSDKQIDLLKTFADQAVIATLRGHVQARRQIEVTPRWASCTALWPGERRDRTPAADRRVKPTSPSARRSWRTGVRCARRIRCCARPVRRGTRRVAVGVPHWRAADRLPRCRPSRSCAYPVWRSSQHHQTLVYPRPRQRAVLHSMTSSARAISPTNLPRSPSAYHRQR